MNNQQTQPGKGEKVASKLINKFALLQLEEIDTEVEIDELNAKIQQLTQANQQLESKNQQLTQANQQLESKNQQLKSKIQSQENDKEEKQPA